MATVPAPEAPAPPPTQRRRGLGLLEWLAVIGLIAIAYVAVRLLPPLLAPASPPQPGTAPAAWIILLVGLAVSVLTAGIVYVALGRHHSFPRLVIALVIAYNALIILLKFTLAPPGIWKQTYVIYGGGQEGANSTAWWNGIAEAIGVFILYALTLLVLFIFFRVRIERRLKKLGQGKPVRRWMAIPLAALFIFAGSLIFIGWLVAPSLSSDDYIRYLFTGATGVAAAVMLAGALTAATMAFQLTSDRATLVRDATLISTVFWVGLGLLAVYHILWVVYVLTLLAFWPVKFTALPPHK